MSYAQLVDSQNVLLIQILLQQQRKVAGNAIGWYLLNRKRLKNKKVYHIACVCHTSNAYGYLVTLDEKQIYLSYFKS